MKKIVNVALVLSLSSWITACVDDQSVQEIVSVEDENKHEFKVQKDGSLQFNAEIVYFKFDDHTLTREGMNRLNAIANYLKKNKKSKLKIQGHCDERGSTEYNLALGQLRSQAVKNYLADLGVGKSRLQSVSFGEEHPVAQGSNEHAWSQNRRADFVLTGLAE